MGLCERPHTERANSEARQPHAVQQTLRGKAPATGLIWRTGACERGRGVAGETEGLDRRWRLIR
eukprot:7473387-Pyramimonas_sp.AAC.1